MGLPDAATRRTENPMRHLRILSIAATAFSLLSPHCIFGREARGSCPTNLVKCFAPGDDLSSDSEAAGSLAATQGLVVMQVRKTMAGGPFAHKWIQLGTADNAVTIGYGPADFPFVDAGQVLVVDAKSVDLVSRWHFSRWHFTPAERPGAGRPVGDAILVTDGQAQNLVTQQRRHRWVAPYIPLFNDCHTFVCAVAAKAQGKFGPSLLSLVQGALVIAALSRMCVNKDAATRTSSLLPGRSG
jgi:hypothetical protein